MPVDPEISLGFKPPEAPNPLATALQFAQAKNALNQNAQFQQVYDARNELGKIFQDAKDPNTGEIDFNKAQTNALTNPKTSAWAGQFMAPLREAQLTQMRASGEMQTQAEKALKMVHMGLFSSAGRPDMLNANVQAAMATVPATVRHQLEPVVSAYTQSILAPKPDGSPVDMDTYHQRLGAIATYAGASPDAASLVFGRPDTIDEGGTKQMGMRDLTTGAFHKTGEPIPMTMTPGEAATPIQGGMDPVTGAPRMVLKGQAAQEYGGAGPGAVAAGGGGAALPASGPKGVTTDLGAGEKETFKNMADFEQDLNHLNENLKESAIAMQVERRAAEAFRTGGWNTERGWVAKQLQGMKNVGIPVTQEFIDRVASGSISDMQTFKAAMTPVVMGQFKQGVEGTGRGMMVEVEKYLKDYPNIAGDPVAYENISNMIAKRARWAQSMQQGMVDFKSKLRAGDPSVQGYTYPDFPAWYNKQQTANHEFEFPDVHGTSKGAAEEMAAKPNAAGGATHRWNAKTNQLEKILPQVPTK